MTTALTEYLGLEAKAQKVFDMPYSELALHFQKAVRSLVAKDAAEEMLEALKRNETLLLATIDFLNSNPVVDYTVVYDEAECDGACLMDDCRIALEQTQNAIEKASGQ